MCASVYVCASVWHLYFLAHFPHQQSKWQPPLGGDGYIKQCPVRLMGLWLCGFGFRPMYRTSAGQETYTHSGTHQHTSTKSTRRGDSKSILALHKKGKSSSWFFLRGLFRVCLRSDSQGCSVLPWVVLGCSGLLWVAMGNWLRQSTKLLWWRFCGKQTKFATVYCKFSQPPSPTLEWHFIFILHLCRNSS